MGPDIRSAGAGARALAARINARVVRDGVSAQVALAEASSHPPKETALVRALVLGALRWHHRLQWQVGQLLSRPSSAADAQLGALIRVGLFQLQWMRIPDHAAVSSTVAAAQLLGLSRAKGVVNAVLRRFQREAVELERRLQDNPEALYSHPAWILDALQAEWAGRWQGIVDANNQTPPMWLRVNLTRASRADYAARLKAAGIDAASSSLAPAAILLTKPQPMESLPGFGDGLVSVQDAGAQLSAGYLELAPGLRVLDACAAPGGKTAQILESAPGLAQVVAVDRDAGRVEALRETLQRLRLQASVRHGDATRPGDWWDGKPFDRILLDAPCTALGVIRRHPDIKVLRRPADVEKMVDEQARLLRALWPLLSVGGKLLYVTCTVLGAENQQQIEAFLTATPGAGLGSGPQRQTLPGEANMDGFYYASIEKLN